MNVKKNAFDISNKQNTPRRINFQRTSEVTVKPKIGEEIRKKLRIQNEAHSQTILELKRRSQNAIACKQSAIQPNVPGVPFINRSIEIEKPSISRSKSKSVRFEDKLDEQKLVRKHSAASILKNAPMRRNVSLSEKGSLNNSICSNILKEDQSSENLSGNRIIKEKFQKLLEVHKKSMKKYNDDLYPPIWSSLSRLHKEEHKDIQWKRISEIFPSKYLVVWDPEKKSTISTGSHSKSHVFASCLNSIKHNHFLLEKMFESQGFCPNGIYYVKINQNNAWKYIIVDDYVPVCVSDSSKNETAFLKVKGDSHQIQIWPLLLQKAYAKYYSTYDALERGSEVDFLQELTGCPIERLSLSGDYERLKQQVISYDTILIAKNNNQRFYPLAPRKPAFTYEDPFQSFSEVQVEEQQFRTQFLEVFCICLHKYFYSGSCTIRHNSKADCHDSISLRCIRIEESTECVFSLVQKDLKHYSSSYRYSWMRMIVVMRESEKNYRWVDAVYCNSKVANLSLWLEPAEYTVIVIPQWTDLSLDVDLVFHGNTKCKIERKPYAGNECVLTESAMDLAQRKGKLNQLNPNICTYSFIEPKVGFIIENINNERPSGHIRILRSIEGLQKKGEKELIRAFNKQFKREPTIEVKIGSLEHFTVILGVLGGVNKTYLQQFDFGS